MDLLTEHQALGGAHHGRAQFSHIARWLLPLSVLLAMAMPLVLLFVLERFAPVEEIGVRHWESNLLLLYVLVNAMIGTSCLAIATILSRAGAASRKLTLLWPFIVLGCFCLSNAGVHIVAAVWEWKPTYWLALSIQYISGVTALGFAIIAPPLVPTMRRLLQSASTSDRHKLLLETSNEQLTRMNETLRSEVLERRKAEDKERATLEHVRSILDNMPLGAIAFDEQHRILHANTLLSELFGIGQEPSALLGRERDEFMQLLQQTIRHHDHYAQHLESMMHEQQMVLGTELMFRDGRVISQDYIPLFVAGRYTGQLFLYRDITREKRIDATKSEFMSLASHQLRTPLTTMRWSFGRLSRSLQGRMNISEERLLLEAKSAAGRMAHTIDTMLAISRVEAGKISLEVTEIKLGNTINEVRTECLEEYTRKRQMFTIDCPPGLFVHTDQYVFKEIIRNLFTNAIKYTPEGGSIHVRVAALHQHVQIDISDTGYGIPTHQQEKIFSKFFRGDNIVQRDTEGTGLGLYLVFLLVKLLGATVFFRSEEGKGTTFTLLLSRHAGVR
jgi:PAS domain S-box-containing protein